MNASSLPLRSLLLAGTTLSLAGHASAVVVFTDGFEDDVPGTVPTQSDPDGPTYGVNTGPNATILVQEDGTGNNVVTFTDTSTVEGSSFNFGASAGEGSTTLSLGFDYTEPTGGGDQALNVRLGNDTGNPNAGVDLFFTNGSILYNNGSSVPTLSTGYSLDTTNSFLIEVDDAANTYDLSLNGSLIGDDLGFRNDVDVSLAAFQTFSGARQIASIDNLILDDGTIPEPASAALLALGSVALLGRRRA